MHLTAKNEDCMIDVRVGPEKRSKFNRNTIGRILGAVWNLYLVFFSEKACWFFLPWASWMVISAS